MARCWLPRLRENDASSTMWDTDTCGVVASLLCCTWHDCTRPPHFGVGVEEPSLEGGIGGGGGSLPLLEPRSLRSEGGGMGGGASLPFSVPPSFSPSSSCSSTAADSSSACSSSCANISRTSVRFVASFCPAGRVASWRPVRRRSSMIS
eukprot:COSAG01_NODE_1037_length_11984_cov_106.566176_4_plen_149_part_00